MRSLVAVCALGAMLVLPGPIDAAEPVPATRDVALESVAVPVAAIPEFRAPVARSDGFAPAGAPSGLPGAAPAAPASRSVGWSSLADAIARDLQMGGVTSAPVFSLDPLRTNVDMQMTLGFEHNVERLTRKSVKRFLLGATGLTRNVEAVEDRVLAQNGITGRKTSGRTVFRFSASRLIPKMTMTRPAGNGSMTFSVTALGTVGLDISPTRSERARFYGGYDRTRDTYDFFCSVRF